MIQLEQHNLFITSIYVTYLPVTGHSELTETIYNLTKTAPCNKRSNQGGYQSFPFEVPNFDNHVIKDLFTDHIQPAAREILDNWGLTSVKLNRCCYWYNINHKYTYNSAHTHPDSFISGVYYVKVPKDSGNIIFDRSESERDRLNHITGMIIDNGWNIDNPNINTEHWFVPIEGMLILFPGHLTHYVQQNLTAEEDSDRISLSFNFY